MTAVHPAAATALRVGATAAPVRNAPRLAVALLLCAMASACGVLPPTAPVVIAHRGASGYLPEHTLEAYALAHAQGADYIEPDVVLTRDGVLVCSHDLLVRDGSDVATRFPGRARPDGTYHVLDFTWDELRSLRLSDDRPPPVTASRYATLDELLALVRRLDATSGRRVGVIPEPKAPEVHRAAGLPIEAPLLAALARAGYDERSAPAIVQCFELESLRVMRQELGCRLRLVLLVDEPLADAELDRIATLADGIAPSRLLIEDEQGRPVDGGALVHRAHARGLAVYPYTFAGEPDALARFFRRYRVDGVFTDTPDVAVAVRGGPRD